MNKIDFAVSVLTLNSMPFAGYNIYDLFEDVLLRFISNVNGAKGQHQKENCTGKHSKVVVMILIDLYFKK